MATEIKKTFKSNKAGDGYVQASSFVNWDTAHDATSGAAVDSSGPSAMSYALGLTRKINRGFTPFDLSAEPIGTNLKFDSMRIEKLAASVVDDDPDGDDWVAFVGPTTQASTASLTANDFDNCGAVNDPIEWTARKVITAVSTTKANTWTLNAAGEAAVCAAMGTGWLMMGFREGHDAIDSPIAANSENSVGLDAAVPLILSRPRFPQVVG